MSSKKYLQLVQLLIKKTDEETATWEPTSKEGVFSLSLPDYSVRISQVRNEDEPNATDVLFQIVDAQGRLIDAFRDLDAAAELSDKRQAFEAMERMYKQARRVALGVDKALDTLIEQLGKS